MTKINLGKVVGPKGEPGLQGPKGDPGLKGDPGKDGVTPDMSLYATKEDINNIQNEINGVNTALTSVIGKEI